MEPKSTLIEMGAMPADRAWSDDGDAETAIDRLDDYADMMFGTEFSSLPSDLLRIHPCAMLEASLLVPHTGGEISPHVGV